MSGPQDTPDILDLPVYIGLRQQGHLGTVEQMLRDGKTWEEIGAAIGWNWQTALDWWAREVLTVLDEARDGFGCDAGNQRGRHVCVFDGERNSERCRCGRYDATRSSHLEFDRQVVPASAIPPTCRECNAPGKLYERPAERRWVHAKREDGRNHDFVVRPIHWSGAPEGVCERKDKKLDAYYPETQANAGGVVGFSALADHPGNVTCPTCKAEANKGCNRHRDCKAAEEAWRVKTGGTFIPANFHCRNEDCEDCFGS